MEIWMDRRQDHDNGGGLRSDTKAPRYKLSHSWYVGHARLTWSRYSYHHSQEREGIHVRNEGGTSYAMLSHHVTNERVQTMQPM